MTPELQLYGGQAKARSSTQLPSREGSPIALIDQMDGMSAGEVDEPDVEPFLVPCKQICMKYNVIY
jgi:hypothetical protein